MESVLNPATRPVESILAAWSEHRPQLELSNRLNQNNLSTISVSGLEGSSPAILISALANLANIQETPILVVTQSSAEAVDLYEDIIAITDS